MGRAFLFWGIEGFTGNSTNTVLISRHYLLSDAASFLLYSRLNIEVYCHCAVFAATVQVEKTENLHILSSERRDTSADQLLAAPPRFQFWSLGLFETTIEDTFMPERLQKSEGFPYERQRLASKPELIAMIEKWKPVFVAKTGSIEDIAFPEDLWRHDFVYARNELSRTILTEPDKAMSVILATNDILAVGDAIFTCWRAMTHWDNVLATGEKYDFFLALFDCLKDLAEKR